MRSKIAFLLVPLLMLMAAAPAAVAQCGGRGVVIRGNTICSTPVIVTHNAVVAHEVITPIVVPIALPVIVPAFTYQYVPPVAVAPAMPVYYDPSYGPGGYPSPGQPVYGQQPQQYGPYSQPPAQPQPTLPVGNNNDKLRELAKLLLEEMRRQDNADNGDDNGPPMAVYPGNQKTQLPGYPTTQSSGRPNPQSPYAQAAINAFAKNCMQCHTGPGAKGEVVIFSQQNILSPDAPFKSMLVELQTGRMPPRQSAYHPSPPEVGVMTAWLEGR